MLSLFLNQNQIPHVWTFRNHFKIIALIVLFLFCTKHSYLDKETSLILKSIAGKPSHLLTKVMHTVASYFLSSVCMLIGWFFGPHPFCLVWFCPAASFSVELSSLSFESPLIPVDELSHQLPPLVLFHVPIPSLSSTMLSTAIFWFTLYWFL